MLNLFIDGTIIEMQPGQDLAVKDILKKLNPETIVLVCGEFNKQTGRYPIIESIPINVLFDVEKNNSKYIC